MKKFEEGNYKEQIMATHKRWADVEYWQALKKSSSKLVLEKYLKGSDM